MITDSSPMPDVLEAMASGCDIACFQFALRQSDEGRAELKDSVETLDDALRDSRFDRPGELAAWRTPSHVQSIDVATLRCILEASAGSEEVLKAQLAEQTFTDICLMSSICAHLRMALRRLSSQSGPRHRADST